MLIGHHDIVEHKRVEVEHCTSVRVAGNHHVAIVVDDLRRRMLLG